MEAPERIYAGSWGESMSRTNTIGYASTEQDGFCPTEYIRADTVEELQKRLAAVWDVISQIYPASTETIGVPSTKVYRTERQSGWNECAMEVAEAIANGSP